MCLAQQKLGMYIYDLSIFVLWSGQLIILISGRFTYEAASGLLESIVYQK